MVNQRIRPDAVSYVAWLVVSAGPCHKNLRVTGETKFFPTWIAWTAQRTNMSSQKEGRKLMCNFLELAKGMLQRPWRVSIKRENPPNSFLSTIVYICHSELEVRDCVQLCIDRKVGYLTVDKFSHHRFDRNSVPVSKYRDLCIELEFADRLVIVRDFYDNGIDV